jgi:hypothetical protein
MGADTTATKVRRKRWIALLVGLGLLVLPPLVLAAKLLYYRVRPVEAAIAEFLERDGVAEDQLIDPLVLAGSRVVPTPSSVSAIRPCLEGSTPCPRLDFSVMRATSQSWMTFCWTPPIATAYDLAPFGQLRPWFALEPHHESRSPRLSEERTPISSRSSSSVGVTESHPTGPFGRP